MNRIARNYRNSATQSPNFLINSLSSNHQKTSQISSNRKLNSSSNLQIRKGKTFTRWATSKLANSSSGASKPKDLPPSNSSNNDNPDDFDDGHDPKDKPNIGVIVDEIPDTTKSNKNNKLHTIEIGRSACNTSACNGASRPRETFYTLFGVFPNFFTDLIQVSTYLEDCFVSINT